MSIYTHGANRNREVKTGDGKSHIHPETYCVLHGWVMTFLWDKHQLCNRQHKPRNGAEFEKPKAMAKAA